MKKRTLILPVYIALMAALITSCKKETDCYDEALYQKHKNDICLQDCPGVIGCDGKKYCNECIARSKGIRAK
jgi:hypothetical protein